MTQEETIIVEKPTHTYGRGWRLDLVVLSLLISLMIIILTIASLYIILQHFIWVLGVYLTAIALLPVLGISWAVIALIRYFRKAQVLPIHAGGTLVRLPNGNTQVFSPMEIFAWETEGAIAKQQLTLNTKVISQHKQELPWVFPDVFPESVIAETAETAETEMETVPYVEPVLEMIEQENDAAKQQAELQKMSLIKERIRRLHEAKIPLRAIAKIVALEGRKYNTFKQLCTELGINTE